MTDVLVVDDDPRLREVVRYALSREGYAVREASDGLAALAEVQRDEPALVVLDVLMPELDGLEVCRRLRAQGCSVPVVFLSSRGEELDRILGLELGGDDYLAKPFSTRELVSRVRAVLRRQRPAADSRLQVGRLALDAEAFRVWIGEDEIGLTVTEFRLLQVMMRRPSRAWTRDELMERAYPGRHQVSGRTLDSHVRRIRSKCREAGLDPIETVHGLGYRLRTEG